MMSMYSGQQLSTSSKTTQTYLLILFENVFLNVQTLNCEHAYYIKLFDVPFIWFGKILHVSGMSKYSGWPVCINIPYLF